MTEITKADRQAARDLLAEYDRKKQEEKKLTHHQLLVEMIAEALVKAKSDAQYGGYLVGMSLESSDDHLA